MTMSRCCVRAEQEGMAADGAEATFLVERDCALVPFPNPEPEHIGIPGTRLRDTHVHQATANAKPVAAAIDVKSDAAQPVRRKQHRRRCSLAEPSRTR